jgi:hypothetical protein
VAAVEKAGLAEKMSHISTGEFKLAVVVLAVGQFNI